MLTPKVLIVLLACAATVYDSPNSGAHHPHDDQVTTEPWSPIKERFVQDPAQFQFASSTKQFPSGETQQIADETSTLQDDFDKTIEGKQSRSTAEKMDTILGVPHEISSFYVLVFLIALIMFCVWIFYKFCCCCQKERTNGTSLRRAPSFRDTMIQRFEDMICMHRDKPRPYALEMSRMMQEKV